MAEEMKIFPVSASRAAILVVALTSLAASGSAQQPNPNDVQVKTTKLATNFYTLEGNGGTVGVLTGPDGVLMVDTQFAPMTEKLVAAIKQISDGRIRFVINTHVHGDHTGGNENLGKMGATIFARENLRARLMKPNAGANGAPGTPAPSMALPVVTYDAPVTIHMNGEDVHLIPVPMAHTDGDTMVHFPRADVIMIGDFYRSLGYPNIDLASGGSLKGLLDELSAAINVAGPGTKIIPGHGVTVDKTAVAAHRAMIMAIRDKVAVLVKQNKTQAEVLAAKVTSDYDAKVTGATPMTADRFVGQLYAELKAGR
jgi:cyclase